MKKHYYLQPAIEIAEVLTTANLLAGSVSAGAPARGSRSDYGNAITEW